MSKIAHIVAIRTGSLGDLGFGISSHAGDVSHIFEEGEVWIGPRPVLELDEDFVQPIPYIVIRKGDEVLAYTRAATGGEGRLHGKKAIGFGGHVDALDIVTDIDTGIIDLRFTMLKACIRELHEELGIPYEALEHVPLEWTHVIQSDATPVDRVHVGLVCQLDISQLPSLDPQAFEDAIENAEFTSWDGLFTDSAAGLIELETWTGLLVGLAAVADA